MADENKQKEPSLVANIFARCKNDKGFAATLKRADNPDTAYQAWEILAAFKVPLDVDSKRLPHALVFAAIARSSKEKDGNLGLGAALSNAYQDDGGKDSDAAKAKLRRILACDNVIEVCQVLRPILQLICSRGVGISFEKLLKDLKFFNPEKTLACWAQDFFGSISKEKEES
ncbi:type I-E CRISPR-associated protein Cse2/CasB [uncultured Fibrobacter sp.]|uniref:type I-E CRISPR-associated protein Cse2/CasB n=1 Tax=uncultured Fibrobacter sp. TaxID=261512 RepID=UPI0025EA604B|nr:type I-E CRISPR-associated protein Cse2/CasB [uncultured Fibrobacter sp.]